MKCYLENESCHFFSLVQNYLFILFIYILLNTNLVKIVS